jgi:predicted NBD/HSP70 family sugar kinase
VRRINSSAFRIARRGTSREINRQISLNLVREKQPISRAELARLLGLRPGAVSLIVNDLLRSGLVFEGAKGQSKGGRRPTQLYIETRRRCSIAIDINASQTSIVATDLLGVALMDVSEFSTGREPKLFVKELGLRVGQILADHPEFGHCIGIGVVVSGLVDLHGGQLKYSPTLGWRDVDLVSPLSAMTRLPVSLENSVKACILAQVWAVSGDLPVDGPVAFVNVSDGVGVGIAVDGKLLRGANNIAGEYGHVPLNMYGPICSCGRRGCLETYVSNRAIIARYHGTDASWAGLPPPGAVTVGEIIARARGGEGRALETLRETGYYLGQGFATIVKSVDPSRIYIGGEITEGWDLLVSMVRDALRERALIPEGGEAELRVVGLSEHPRLRGAAALVLTPAFAAPTVA